MFKKATMEQSKLRMGITGPAGSGKTYTALRIAAFLGKKVAVRCSEHGSAAKYADAFDFDMETPDTHHPLDYVRAINEAAQGGYDVLVLDSLSHAWSGKDGALELVDRVSVASRSNNSFTAWRDVTPHHNAMIEAILGAPLHIIATMRTKTEWVMETNDRGKMVPVKKGMAPVQRAGMDYEFDVVGDFADPDKHIMVIDKTRCAKLDGMQFTKPGEDIGAILLEWLTTGAVPAPVATAETPMLPAERPEVAALEAANVPAPAGQTANQLHTEIGILAIELYGPGWRNKMREIVGAITAEATLDILELNENQLAVVLGGLQKKKEIDHPAFDNLRQEIRT